MPWGVVAAGLSLAGGVVAANASRNAARTQGQSADRATEEQRRMYDQQREDQAPWRTAGANALGEIATGFGTGPGTKPGEPGYFNHTFGASDLNATLAPNWQFMRDQGLGAIRNSGAAMGLGGNSLKGVIDYAENYAGNAYQQAYTNYTANQTNIYNRLASIAGLGQTAGSNQTTGGSAYAGNIGNNITGAGNARAAGIVGGANAISGAVNNAAGWYAYSNMNNPATRPVDTSPISYTNPAAGNTYTLDG